MIDISFVAKEKDVKSSNGVGYASSITNITNISAATVADRLANMRKIWGNDFDGSKDVDGDFMLNQHRLEVLGGQIEYKSFYNDKSFIKFNPADDVDMVSDLYIEKTNVWGDDVEFDLTYGDNNSKVLLNKNGFEVKGNAVLTAPTLIVDSIDSKSSSIIVQKMLKLVGGVDLSGEDLAVKNLESENIINKETIKTKDLVVSGNAHFFNLVIDEVKHSGGQMILSPGNFHIDKLEYLSEEFIVDNVAVKQHSICGNDSAYKCIRLFQVANSEDGDVINNTIEVNDHIFCWTTNILNNNITRHYWTAVIGKGDGVLTLIDEQNKYCNYIDIVYSVKHNGEWKDPNYGVVNPKVDDNLAVLGSLNSDRQSAIIISAYKSPDNEIEAPSIAQYAGIDSWSFENKRTTYFAKNNNRIQGDLYIKSGENVEDFLGGVESGKTSYIHVAYANSGNGQKDFTKDAALIDAPLFIGFCSDFNESDANLVYSDYTWSRLRDENEPVIYNKLIPVRERLYLTSENDLYLDVHYDVTNWSKMFTILCKIYKTDGSSTPVQLSRYMNNERRYMGATLKVSEEWNKDEVKYVYCRIEMLDSESNIVDSHNVEVSYEAAATLKITNDIVARVSDAEGNISTLTVASDSIKSRVELLEAEVTGQAGESGTVIDKVAELEVEVDAITGTVTRHTGELNAVNQSIQTVQEQYSQIKQEVDNISLTVSEKVYGGVNIVDGTDFNPENLDTLKKNYVEYNPINVMKTGASVADIPNKEYGVLEFISDDKTVFNKYNYTEIIKWRMTGKMIADEWYTLSFYMKNPNGNITSYVYAPDLSTNASGGTDDRWIDGVKKNSASDNTYQWPASDVWTKHIYTFKTSKLLTNTTNISLLFRALASDISAGYPELHLSQVKLELGQVATDYSISQRDIKSEIEMSADEINLQITNGLKTTGINIATGEINLNADNTNIIGNLNLKNSDNGLTVFDDEGVARVNIRPSEIGEYGSGLMTSLNPVSVPGEVSGTPKKFSDLTFKKTKIGRYKKNTQLTIKTARLMVNAYDANNMMQAPLCDYVNLTCQIINSAGSVVATKVLKMVEVPENILYVFLIKLGCNQYVSETPWEWNVTADDEYYVQFIPNYVNIVLPDLMSGYTSLWGNISAQFSQYVENQTFVGIDGFYSTPKDNTIVWCGRDEIRIQENNAPNHMLVFNEDGIRQSGGYINIRQSDNSYIRKPQLYSLWNYVPICFIGEDNSRPITARNIENLASTQWSYFIDPDKDNGIIMVHAPMISGGTILNGRLYIVLPDIDRQDADGNWYTLPAGYKIEIWNRVYSGGQSYNNYKKTQVFVCVNKVWNSFTQTAKQKTIIDANRDLNWEINMNGSGSSKMVFIWTGWYWVCEHDV